MAGLYAPLPTLRRRPRGRLRTDRGRRGLLLLHRSGLSPHTPCQSPGALTHVTARRIAQPPKAAFVTRLQPCRLPGRTARQLPDQSTTLWVESSSTSDPRLRGALPIPDIRCLTRKPRLPRLAKRFAVHAGTPTAGFFRSRSRRQTATRPAPRVSISPAAVQENFASRSSRVAFES